MSRYATRRATTTRATRARNARIAAFVGDGAALVAFLLFIGALVALVPTVFSDNAYGPCASEDGVNCYWDAKAQGNGAGRSFIDVAGVAYYIGD